MKVGTDAIIFGAWVRHAGAMRILDIGTGTGLLALIAAQRAPEAEVHAVEIDDDAAAQAAENFAASPWSDRVRAHRMDVRRMRSDGPFDLVVCNPPYYPGQSVPADERTRVAKHGAELSFEQLLEHVARLLAPAGRFAVIIPADREVEFLGIAERRGLLPARRCALRYVAHRPAKRIMLECSHGPLVVEREELVVEGDAARDRSPAVQALVADLLDR